LPRRTPQSIVAKNDRSDSKLRRILPFKSEKVENLRFFNDDWTLGVRPKGAEFRQHRGNGRVRPPQRSGRIFYFSNRNIINNIKFTNSISFLQSELDLNKNKTNWNLITDFVNDKIVSKGRIKRISHEMLLAVVPGNLLILKCYYTYTFYHQAGEKNL